MLLANTNTNQFIGAFEEVYDANKEAINDLLRICPNQNTGFRLWNMPYIGDEDVKDSRIIADFINVELETNQKFFRLAIMINYCNDLLFFVHAS